MVLPVSRNNINTEPLSSESISYGAHQIRDGVNLTEQKRSKAVVSANDIITLNDLEAYIQLPGNWPIAKLKFAYHTVPDISKDFIKRDWGDKDTVVEDLSIQNL